MYFGNANGLQVHLETGILISPKDSVLANHSTQLQKRQLNSGKNIVTKGFRKGFIREAYDQASALQNFDHPSLEMDIDVEWSF